MTLINEQGLDVFLGFFVLLPFLAAAFPVLDTVIKEGLPFSAAWRSKEFWTLWGVYTVIALFAVLGLHAKNTLDYGIFGFLGVFFGFPMLLQSKLFGYRDPRSGVETAVGFEYLLHILNHLLVPGMKNSIDEHIASLQGRWLALTPQKLGPVIKNYLTSHAAPGEPENILPWVDQLIADAIADPANKDTNLRVLFLEVRKAGGSRGVAYVIKHSV